MSSVELVIFDQATRFGCGSVSLDPLHETEFGLVGFGSIPLHGTEDDCIELDPLKLVSIIFFPFFRFFFLFFSKYEA